MKMVHDFLSHRLECARTHHRWGVTGVLIGGLLAVFLIHVVPSTAQDSQPAELPGIHVTLEHVDGTLLSGRLERIESDKVVLDEVGTSRTVDLQSVRRIQRVGQLDPVDFNLQLTWIDGCTLRGNDFAWDGNKAQLIRPEGSVEMPIERVRSLNWQSQATKSADDHDADDDPLAGGRAETPQTPSWLESVPESTESDLVVIGSSEKVEFVECAITAVSAETVTVSLEEEKISVKRLKVIGLQWLRDNRADKKQSDQIVVDVVGGSLRGNRVEWSPDGLLVNGDIRLPACMFVGVDYAAGRMTSLTTLPTERLEVDPYFAALGKVDGLAEFFAPREMAADRQWPRSGLVMRPRTVAVWRMPADSRRFRMTVAPAGGQHATGGAVVIVAADDREVFRREVDAGLFTSESVAVSQPSERTTTPKGADIGIPVDIDLAGVRRLTITVDFAAPGTTNAAVRLTQPVIEK